MTAIRTVLFTLLVASATAQVERVTPVQKVITLLTDLKGQVETEGVAEAKTYDDFACFCKKTSGEKSDSITNGRDDIDEYSADIAEKTASRVEKTDELEERKVKDENLKKELQETTVRCDKEQAEYEATEADLSKAISSLESAIQAMESSRPSLLQFRNSVQESLELADVLGLIAEPKRSAVSSFLQSKAAVDPSDPEYKYHSQGIIDTLDKLLLEFRDEKATLDAEWAKTKINCDATKLDLSTSIDGNQKSMDQLDKDIGILKGEIATARENLVTAEGQLKDDQQYMKDLTERCELRAKDWDQRSQMRADEIAALAGALKVLQDDVAGRDAQVNERALLQRSTMAQGVSAAPAKKISIAPHIQGASFVQEAATISKARTLLRGRTGLSAEATQAKVAALLSKEGQRLSSPVLSMLATKVAADPFAKIKTLIQELIERLLKESEAEATKKGFCDTELGKAKKDRDFRQQDAKDLNIELKALELKQVDLEEEISLLTGQVADLKQTLNETETQRNTEHDENMVTLEEAKEGLQAVKQAITILKVFYKNAAKAVLIQASPVDEDTDGAGFSGNYGGKQEASKGIIGMLEVIKTDFERTIRTTEASEKKAHADFTKFERTSLSDIGGKETKLKLDEEDLETTKNTITSKMADMQTAVNRLDSALKTLEDLKPTCIDTGMSYDDRVKKREEEMTALKAALCILDTDGVEAKCL